MGFQNFYDTKEFDTAMSLHLIGPDMVNEKVWGIDTHSQGELAMKIWLETKQHPGQDIVIDQLDTDVYSVKINGLHIYTAMVHYN